MARPIKKSLDYFSLDVGIFNDRKIKRLLKDFGGKGFSIYIYLLTEIYGDKGYYLIWDNYYPGDIADALGNGFTANLVSEVLVYCVKTGLFDRELFNSSVITSRSIQERYVEAKNKVLGDDSIASLISPEYNLLSANKTIKSDLTELNNIKPSLTELNDIKSDLTELNGVSTLKESKEKETKKEESKEKNIFPIDSFLPEAKKESKSSKEIELNKDFEDWWNEYPKKKSKKEAEKAYIKARKKASKELLLNALLEILNKDWKFREDKQFIPNASTWLNQERWNDEVQTVKVPNKATQTVPLNENQVFKEFLNGK